MRWKIHLRSSLFCSINRVYWDLHIFFLFFLSCGFSKCPSYRFLNTQWNLGIRYLPTFLNLVSNDFHFGSFFNIKKFCFEWVAFSNRVELEYQESKGNFLFIYLFSFKIPLFLCPPLSNAHHPCSDRLTDCGLTDQGCGLSDGLSVCGRH